jgi:hypothetical protein
MFSPAGRCGRRKSFVTFRTIAAREHASDIPAGRALIRDKALFMHDRGNPQELVHRGVATGASNGASPLLRQLRHDTRSPSNANTATTPRRAGGCSSGSRRRQTLASRQDHAAMGGRSDRYSCGGVGRRRIDAHQARSRIADLAALTLAAAQRHPAFHAASGEPPRPATCCA